MHFSFWEAFFLEREILCAEWRRQPVQIMQSSLDRISYSII